MTRSIGDMASSRYLPALMATLHFIAFTYGGPVGPLPNVTSADMGLKQGGCTLGDVEYLPGDQFPGSNLCERCTCGAGGVRCTQEQCEPRPGCKVLHRPDHCCPTYQCECQQEGRVYRNGEKLVDPLDPCRVCYCQGGEVVCRRIACFVRDDCSPRLVPGRCCPEYDNCPLRGVTSLPGVTLMPSVSPVDQVEAIPAPPKEIKQEFTIKEITPVSEIPIITDVKIKEILPSPSIEVAEYSSSKSPLITREATSEKAESVEPTKPEPEVPSVIEVHPSEDLSQAVKTTEESKRIDDAPPSKFSLSTQDSINSEIYPSNIPIVITMGVPAGSSDTPAAVVTPTKSQNVEEEDPSLFTDHNPAFPPLPDDLSVLSNHGDEIVPEPSADTDHISMDHAHTPDVIVMSLAPSTEATKKPLTTTFKDYPETTIITTEKPAELSTDMTTKLAASTDAPISKENPTVNLRSAIPTEIFDSPPVAAPKTREEPTTTITDEPLSLVTSTTTGTTSETSTITTTTNSGSTTTSAPAADTPTITAAVTETSTTTETSTATETSTTTAATKPTSTVTMMTTTPAAPSSSRATTIDGTKSIENMSIEYLAKTKIEEAPSTGSPQVASEETTDPKASEEIATEEPDISIERVSFLAPGSTLDSDGTTLRSLEAATTESSSTNPQDNSTSSISKSNMATEVTSQTELSSLPIETSDQNPHDAAENVSRASVDGSTAEPLATAGRMSPVTSEVITVAKTDGVDNIETTEFVLSALGSAESSTDAVELIKIAGDSERSAAIVDGANGKNALTDLFKLVNDMSSISHTDAPLAATTLADSEELIPVNAGYKSKNKNFNQNSITEMPSFKSKGGAPGGKQRVVEIEDDEAGISDPSSPNDRAEPTTRRPIIDNVSDDATDAKSDKKDIEIITQSYVPTINRRPTKVVQEERAETTTTAAARGAGDAGDTTAPQ